MPTDTIEVKPSELVRYHISESDLLALKEKFALLRADTKEGYEETRAAIADLRTTRSKIESRRVELKAEALSWSRIVDSEAKRLTNLVLSMEEPLKAAKKAIDDEKDRLKREKEEAERAKIEAEIQAKKDAEEIKLRAERDAERQRLKEESERVAAARAKLDAERQKAEAEQAERLAKLHEEQKKIDAERAAERKRIEAEQRQLHEEREAFRRTKEKADREEFERQAKIRADHEAKERAEKERIAAEEARIAKLEREAAEKKRLEAIMPDVEKVHGLAAAIRVIAIPDVKSAEAKSVLRMAGEVLANVAADLERFGAK